MHVIMRFELERALLRGEMDVDALPGAWRARMRELLQVDVPDDRRGCLQDVHWSSLAIGYFPTYLLGALMAAQLAHHMRADMPDLDAKIAAGEFGPIRAWLNERVHRHGSVPRSMDDLLERALGEPLKTKYFIACAAVSRAPSHACARLAPSITRTRAAPPHASARIGFTSFQI